MLSQTLKHLLSELRGNWWLVSLKKRPGCTEFPYCYIEATGLAILPTLCSPSFCPDTEDSWSVAPPRWSLTSPGSKVFGFTGQRGSWISGQQQASDRSESWSAQVKNIICLTLFRTAASQTRIILFLHKLVKVFTLFKYCQWSKGNLTALWAALPPRTDFLLWSLPKILILNLCPLVDYAAMQDCFYCMTTWRQE